MREWRYLVFSCKIPFEPLDTGKEAGRGIPYQGAMCFRRRSSGRRSWCLEQLGVERRMTVKSVLIEQSIRLKWIKKSSWQPMLHAVSKTKF